MTPAAPPEQRARRHRSGAREGSRLIAEPAASNAPTPRLPRFRLPPHAPTPSATHRLSSQTARSARHRLSRPPSRRPSPMRRSLPPPSPSPCRLPRSAGRRHLPGSSRARSPLPGRPPLALALPVRERGRGKERYDRWVSYFFRKKILTGLPRIRYVG